MAPATIADLRFNGTWVGETQGCEMPAHRWEIRQRGAQLTIRTVWEGDSADGFFRARVLPGQAAFLLAGRFTAVLVDPQHFIIPGWDTNDTRGGLGPDYDVVFSRPGLAELTAHLVWQRFRAGLAKPPAGE